MEDIHIQTQDNLPSIEHILRPLTYTSWLLGAGVAHPRKYPKIVTIIPCIIYLGLCFTVMMVNYILFFNMYNLFKNIYTVLSFVQLMMSYVFTYYCNYQVIGQYDKWPELMDKIKELDQKIRREIPINDGPVKIAEALAILATFSCFPLCIIVDILYYHFTYPNLVQVYFILAYYKLGQSFINSFVFDVVVYALYYRLQAINKLIGQLNEFSDALKIRRIRKMHNRICDLFIMVNDIYSVNLLLCSVNCFTTILAALSGIYVGIWVKQYHFMWIHITFLILYTMQFGLMCWNCAFACQEYDKTEIIIYDIMLNFKHMNLELKGKRSQSNLEMRTLIESPHSLQNTVWNSSHYWNNIVAENLQHAENLRENLNCKRNRNEINDFLIQLQHRRIVFTACDFFEINFVAFGGFIGIIIGYMIVCIPFFERWLPK
ncbi:uncharacterized protein LOC105831477 isoform X2 [Monomorium pharaonis]|uniref:uncharacterized protein LOC105831477 isoform X2 n=1 Tax=Monomorium pharaonis TaxID=307658 RepID=UPI0017461CF4|nr:uncharacterized protein LOC105831477 isoform X2 [Monomorium pharaonis]